MKTFRELQEANELVLAENGFHEYPECYAVVSDEGHEALLLEDLREKGFEMVDHRTEPVTFDHARLVLSALGKYHALSFALKDQSHKEFKEFAENIPDVLFDENNDRVKGYFETFKPLIYGTLEDDENELRQKLAGIFEPSVFDAIKRCVDGPGAEPYAVICHGDCWTNNTLYKFDEAI